MGKEVIKNSIKTIVWIVGFLILFWLVTSVFQPKYLFSQKAASPESELWDAFYREPKDTVDVIFIGSSHVYNSINPILFYEETNLTGFDLSSSSQDMPTSYFYLKEALRYQSPKYVILDSYGMMYDAFSIEVAYKRSLDNMRWSSVKLEAVKAWIARLEGEHILPRLFTIMDYHNRWEELTEADFDYQPYVTLVNGYCPWFEAMEYVHHDRFSNDTDLPKLEEWTLYYFDLICQLCEENGIELKVINAPDTYWTEGNSRACEQLLENYQIVHRDYNRPEVYEAIGLQDAEDYRNSGHLNTYGAAKFTRFLAQDLIKEQEITKGNPPEQIKQLWQEKTGRWNRQYYESDLRATKNLKDYLMKLQHQDYYVCMVLQNNRTIKKWKKAVGDTCSEIGMDLSGLDKKSGSCRMIWQGDQTLVKEDQPEPEVLWKGDEKVSVQLTSSETSTAGLAEIVINNKQYALQQDGMNIVVYSAQEHRVIDSAVFHLNKKGDVLRAETE